MGGAEELVESYGLFALHSPHRPIATLPLLYNPPHCCTIVTQSFALHISPLATVISPHRVMTQASLVFAKCQA